MGLPSRKYIIIAWLWQNVLSHTCPETLDMPFLRPMEAKLTVKGFLCDLRGFL